MGGAPLLAAGPRSAGPVVAAVLILPSQASTAASAVTGGITRQE